jgi:hypothetical protein
MQIQKIIVPIASVLLVMASFSLYGWPGVAVSVGALVMWLLLHFNRMMQVLKRAAGRPIGHVASAVMLNAKLKPGVTLMHVVAMTQALGQQTSAKDAQPECFRWTDGSESYVDCEFIGGKLTNWALTRPVPDESGADSVSTLVPAPSPAQSKAAGTPAVPPDSAAP